MNSSKDIRDVSKVCICVLCSFLLTVCHFSEFVHLAEQHQSKLHSLLLLFGHRLPAGLSIVMLAEFSVMILLI